MRPDRDALDQAMGGVSIWGILCLGEPADPGLAANLEWHLGFLDGIFVYENEPGAAEVLADLNVLVGTRREGAPSIGGHEGRFRHAGWAAFETSYQPMIGDWILALSPHDRFTATGDERVALLDIMRFARHDRMVAAKLRAPEGAEIRLVKYDPNFKFANRRSGGGLTPAPRGPILDATDWSGGFESVR